MRSALRRDSTLETRAKTSPSILRGAGTGAAATAAGTVPSVRGRMSFRPKNFCSAIAVTGAVAIAAGALAGAVAAGATIDEAGAAVTMMFVIGRYDEYRP